jgi:hypothetical protein
MIVDLPHESKRKKWQSSNAADGVMLRPLRCWPKSGRHILAQFNDQGVIAYQRIDMPSGSLLRDISFSVENSNYPV